MLPKFLVQHVTNFVFHADRAKVHGRMWGGKAVSIVNGNKFQLSLWHHGEDNETEESLKPELCVKTVMTTELIGGRDFFDIYWNCLFDDDSFWCHPTGWFEDRQLHDKIPQRNTNFDNRILPVEEMIELGFIRIV